MNRVALAEILTEVREFGIQIVKTPELPFFGTFRFLILP